MRFVNSQVWVNDGIDVFMFLLICLMYVRAVRCDARARSKCVQQSNISYSKNGFQHRHGLRLPISDYCRRRVPSADSIDCAARTCAAATSCTDVSIYSSAALLVHRPAFFSTCI